MGLKDDVEGMLQGPRNENAQTTDERLDNTTAAVREVQAAVVLVAGKLEATIGALNEMARELDKQAKPRI